MLEGLVGSYGRSKGIRDVTKGLRDVTKGLRDVIKGLRDAQNASSPFLLRFKSMLGI